MAVLPALSSWAGGTRSVCPEPRSCSSAPGRWGTRYSRTWPCWVPATSSSPISTWWRTRTSPGRCCSAKRIAASPKPPLPQELAAIYPQLRVQPFCGNVVYELGMGVYRWADVILGGLDNREARVAINRAAARAGKIWIDGAIERLDGVARVFDPACGPCYECTMSEIDWQMLHSRREFCPCCSRDDMAEGKVPTTPTTASVIAGIQCQEAVKLIHGLETLSGRGFVFDGMSHQSYVVAYTRNDDCPAHDPDAAPEVLSWQIGETRAGDFLERVRGDLGPEAVVEFNSDLLGSLDCPKCGTNEALLAALARSARSGAAARSVASIACRRRFIRWTATNRFSTVRSASLACRRGTCWPAVAGWSSVSTSLPGIVRRFSDH